MPSILRTYSSAHSNASSSNNSKSRQGSVLDAVTFSSQSTAPTSVAAPGSPVLIDGKPPSYEEAAVMADMAPLTHCYPCASSEISVSADTEQDIYDDDDNDNDNADNNDDDDDDDDDNNSSIVDDDDGDYGDDDPYSGLGHGQERHSVYDEVVPRLPEYRHAIVDDTVRPSTPDEFAQLFPSLNRMAIRHDEFTTDGNMNLRVDITLPGSSGGGGRRHRPTTYQLFHLRMYDLAKREFSLRRYCRDSGREVCSTKRLYRDPAAKHSHRGSSSHGSRSGDGDGTRGSSGSSNNSSSSHGMPPALQRSMSMALRSLSAVAMKRTSRSRPSTSHSPYGSDADAVAAANMHMAALSSRSMPSFFGRSASKDARGLVPPPLPPPPKPTNTIKLEFSNYARVDVERKSSDSSNIRYTFEWWGHTYTWKRIPEKHLDVVSYHLLRDGSDDTPVAHIVPEMRSLNEVHADEAAGGWIPPCHLWIADPSVLEAKTDVSDIIVATGLMALVDDCIRMRWAPLRTESHHFWTAAPLAARNTLQHVFHRRHGSSGHALSPLRHAQPIQTY